ncbi:hypothetical protein LCGC14_2453850, partial [marine sediment metagenome]
MFDANPISALRRESDYFDATVEGEGEFNPFADRGWKTIARQFSHMLPLQHGARLLDVGCGTGQSRKLYIDKCETYTGLDISLRALDLARDKFPESSWVHGDASQMPFADEQFDIVALSSVLHHIKDFAKVACEAFRVLRPGGYAFAFDPNLLHPAMALFRHPRSIMY